MINGSSAAVSDVAVARAIATAVVAVPGVAGLSVGRSAEVATYGAHEKVQGVIVRHTAEVVDVEVHICARYSGSLTLAELGKEVREAARPSVEAAYAGRFSRIDVVVDDLLIE